MVNARRPSPPAGTADSPETLRPSGPVQLKDGQSWWTPHGAPRRSSWPQRATITTEQRWNIEKITLRSVKENISNRLCVMPWSEKISAVENLECLLLFLEVMRLWRWSHRGDICHSCCQQLKHRRFETGINPSIYPYFHFLSFSKRLLQHLHPAW